MRFFADYVSLDRSSVGCYMARERRLLPRVPLTLDRFSMNMELLKTPSVVMADHGKEGGEDGIMGL